MEFFKSVHVLLSTPKPISIGQYTNRPIQHTHTHTTHTCEASSSSSSDAFPGLCGGACAAAAARSLCVIQAVCLLSVCLLRLLQ